MSASSELRRLFHEWRRRTLPPSVNDLEWRYNELVMRLDRMELKTREFAAAASSTEMQNEVLEILRLLQPQRAVGYKKVRVGSPGDGGYVQIDDLEGIRHALSFGVCDDDSWDLAMAKADVPVEQFDHSVERAPSTHPLLTFHRKKITPVALNDTATLEDLISEHSSGETPDIILKIDIEGCEWDVFDKTPVESLSKVAQILAEFHDFSQLEDIRFRTRARRVMQKLHDQFAVTHVHANNCGTIGAIANICLPDVLELSFANRKRYSFDRTDETFPTPLDAPNRPEAADYVLGAFRF